MANGKVYYENEHDKFQRLSFLSRGGNGNIYKVQSLEKQYPYNLVVKVLHKLSKNRKMRFEREIETVLSIQNDIKGILPIVSHSDNTDNMWYAMPEAVKIQSEFKDKSLEYKVEVFIELAQVIESLHNKSLYHRDIKPDNILFYEDRVCLSDFGLVFREDWRLTASSEKIGPVYIRPPELEHDVVRIKDFSASDIYLFAKTMWMLIKNDSYGFRHKYTRDNPKHYLKKDDYGVDTLEPLHRLMEDATEDAPEKRIKIDQVIMLLKQQLLIIRGEYDQAVELKIQERFKEISFSVHSNGLVYTEYENIREILDDILKYTKQQLFIEEENVFMDMNFSSIKNFGDPYEKIFSFKDHKGFEVLIKINRIIFEQNQVFTIETGLLEKFEGYQSIFSVEDMMFLGRRTRYIISTPVKIKCHPYY